jgi:cardiolipin synthase C
MSRRPADAMRNVLIGGLVALLLAGQAALAQQAGMPLVDAQIAAHAGQSGAYVLDSAEEALLARAWLADHAQATIEVQYFIWSSDNIGILAAEALLRAAERGVKVRLIVDDLLVDAPPESLLALARHPNFELRIYNPKVSVGVPWLRRIWNAVTDLRGVNQRMHDKTFVVDGKVAIVGGRNMAAEYYDFHRGYNFRDRDVLLAGAVVADIRASFERFWNNELAAPVATLYEGELSEGLAAAIYALLHVYAAQPENFAPGVRAALQTADSAFARMANVAVWGRVEFIYDLPGKNTGRGLGDGGRSAQLLQALVTQARARLVVQSPYLVPSDNALGVLTQALERNVTIRISTNSLASTDNLQAFAGYRNQRAQLLEMGLQIFEYRPDAATQAAARARELVSALPATGATATFGLHAKTMVIDSKVAFIGTYNLDPRSENLNTEVGVVIYNESLARAVEQAIETDMQAANSWNAADGPDRHVSLAKRGKVRFWQWLPVKPLL